VTLPQQVRPLGSLVRMRVGACAAQSVKFVESGLQGNAAHGVCKAPVLSWLVVCTWPATDVVCDCISGSSRSRHSMRSQTICNGLQQWPFTAICKLRTRKHRRQDPNYTQQEHNRTLGHTQGASKRPCQ
jgi:hypothetical protein